MAFDINTPYLIVKSTQGVHYYLQGGAYYNVDSPFASVASKDVGALLPDFSVGGGASSVTNALTLTDRSGTIAVGGTSQQVMAAVTSRRRLFIQNPTDASEDLWVNFGSAASSSTAGSISLSPGGVIDLSAPADAIDPGTVNVVAATTGHKYTAKEG